MGFWSNLSKLFGLTRKYGGSNVHVLSKSELERTMRIFDRRQDKEESKKSLRILDLEKELSQIKERLIDTDFIIKNRDSREKAFQDKIKSQEALISQMEVDYQRLKKIEVLSKTLEAEFRKTLSDNKAFKSEIDELRKESLRLKQIETLSRKIVNEVTTLKSDLQKRDYTIVTSNAEITSLKKTIEDLEITIRDEKKKHADDLVNAKNNERRNVMEEVAKSVTDSIVPLIHSDKNLVPDRMVFDEINEKNQKLFIKEERMEANNKLNEVQVHLAQNDAKQAQFESRVEKRLLEIRQEKLLVDYGQIQNELRSYELTMKDFIQNKQVEFMRHEITMQNYMVEMSRNILIAEGKLLESEKNKMMVLEQVAQMGIEIKKQETYLEKSLLLAERLKFDADKQNFVNQQQEAQIALAINRFDVEYSNKMLDMSRKELDLDKMNFSNVQFQDNILNVVKEFQAEYERNKLEMERSMHGIEKGNFTNQVEAAMLEMQKQTTDIQNHLKSLAFERDDLDMYFREKQVNLGSSYNTMQNASLQNERILEKIEYAKKEMVMHDRMENLKFQFSAAMDNARFQYQSQMSNMQNQMSSQQSRIEKESINNSRLQLQNAKLKETVNQYYGRKK